jgi:hypothetical protein
MKRLEFNLLDSLELTSEEMKIIQAGGSEVCFKNLYKEFEKAFFLGGKPNIDYWTMRAYQCYALDEK